MLASLQRWGSSSCPRGEAQGVEDGEQLGPVRGERVASAAVVLGCVLDGGLAGDVDGGRVLLGERDCGGVRWRELDAGERGAHSCTHAHVHRFAYF
jgi:hypothetical protein